MTQPQPQQRNPPALVQSPPVLAVLVAPRARQEGSVIFDVYIQGEKRIEGVGYNDASNFVRDYIYEFYATVRE